MLFFSELLEKEFDNIEDTCLDEGSFLVLPSGKF